ncbi:uncharacterized protein [Parasteatoda tepidariorum]|uniref:uncharacterized protein n=1 Tax=Parasteatoda tepidariorum TaxID=114398 RepID=UPI0039BD7A3F
MLSKNYNTFFSTPFVILPDWNKSFILNTDASKVAIAGVLLQEKEGNLHPVSFFSKMLSPSERSYPAIKLELFAIFKSIIAFKQYLYNRKFVLQTDAKSLIHYKKVQSPADLITRWLLQISEYDFTIEHVPGSKNVLPDYLSRILNGQEMKTPISFSETTDDRILPYIDTINALVTNTPKNEISISTIRPEQMNDPSTLEVIQFLKSNSLRGSQQFKNFFLHPQDNVLMFLSHKDDMKIVLPESLKSKALQIAHFNHFGFEKTYQFLTQRYFWKNMYTDCRFHVLSCDKCIRLKRIKPKQAPFLNHWIPDHPGQFISLDILGPIDGHHVLTVLDHFSKFLVLYPLLNITSNQIIKHILNYISLHGRPAYILTDRGKQFIAEAFHCLNNALGIKLSHTTPYHAQSNGQSERINLSIKSTIKILKENNISFEIALQIHQQMYNAATHSTTGFSPNLLHLGRQVSLFFDTFNKEVSPSQLDSSSYIQQVLTQLQSSYKLTYENLLAAQDIQNKRHLTKSKLRQINVGDTVYLKDDTSFKTMFQGPFSVINKINTHIFEIQWLDNEFSPSKTVHIDRLHCAPPRRHQLLDCISPPMCTSPKTVCQYNLRSRK